MRRIPPTSEQHTGPHVVRIMGTESSESGGNKRNSWKNQAICIKNQASCTTNTRATQIQQCATTIHLAICSKNQTNISNICDGMFGGLLAAPIYGKAHVAVWEAKCGHSYEISSPGEPYALYTRAILGHDGNEHAKIINTQSLSPRILCTLYTASAPVWHFEGRPYAHGLN